MSAQSPASFLASLPVEDRQRILSYLSPQALTELQTDWKFWSRPEQRAPPGKWRTWVLVAGRGFGKTRTATEWIRERVENDARRIALVGRTAADVRDTMIEGESGVLNIWPEDLRPIYEPSKRRVTFHTGAIATGFTSEKPDQLRGPEHDTVWFDELAAFIDPRYTYDMAKFGCRIGDDPRMIVTTTPKPLALLKELIADDRNVVTRGSTYDNLANLSIDFIEDMRRMYEGTTIGQQEIYAAILDEAPGALWKRDLLNQTRVRDCGDLDRIVVGVDPPATTKGTCGIVVVGVTHGHGFVIADRSRQGTPKQWAQAVADAFTDFKADRIVAERNQGGDMVEHTIHSIDEKLPVKLVHASRGKRTRAEPIAALYEQGKIHHVGLFADLEDQLCSWVPGDDDSPDRLDALVWACTEILLGSQPILGVSVGGPTQASYWRGG